jgi:hypothetical protein
MNDSGQLGIGVTPTGGGDDGPQACNGNACSPSPVSLTF